MKALDDFGLFEGIALATIILGIMFALFGVVDNGREQIAFFPIAALASVISVSSLMLHYVLSEENVVRLTPAKSR